MPPATRTSCSIARPFIGYPAVVYTGKYADPVARLKQAVARDLAAARGGNAKPLGYDNPDVDRIQVTVEVETLKMDNLESVSGKENYVHLYTTMQPIPRGRGGRARLRVPRCKSRWRYRNVNSHAHR